MSREFVEYQKHLLCQQLCHNCQLQLCRMVQLQQQQLRQEFSAVPAIETGQGLLRRMYAPNFYRAGHPQPGLGEVITPDRLSQAEGNLA